MQPGVGGDAMGFYAINLFGAYVGGGMKKVSELVVPMGDAENYRAREDKAFFNDVYFRTDYLDSLLDPRKYFLCGDKGTGKTAMAVYLHNNDYKDTRADHVFIRDTEIRELNNLRRSGRLALPDSSLLWETAILLRVARMVDADVLDNGWLEKYSLLKSIKAALEKYYEERQNPEIKVDIEILKNRQLAATLVGEGVGKVDSSTGKSTKEKYPHFRDLVYAVNAQLKMALSKARYRRRIVILLDGLDNRGEGTDPGQYKETLSALGSAVWSLNADFFSGIRDTLYRPKVVLLMRPEIVELIGLSNAALKMRDNAVELDWVVNDEAKFADSKLFRLVSHIISAQQAELQLDPARTWNHYFPYAHLGRNSFAAMLRQTYHRPRDLLTYIEYMRSSAGVVDNFELSHFTSPETERKFSEYLLAEIRNGLEYKLGRNERDLIPLFFKSFKGKKRISYAEYCAAHENFSRDCKRRDIIIGGSVFDNPDRLLQLLFENNILAYIENTSDRSYFRWFFRERTLGDPAPKVEFDLIYVVHDGLAKALDVGAQKERSSVVKKAKSTGRRRRRRGNGAKE